MQNIRAGEAVARMYLEAMARHWPTERPDQGAASDPAWDAYLLEEGATDLGAARRAMAEAIRAATEVREAC